MVYCSGCKYVYFIRIYMFAYDNFVKQEKFRLHIFITYCFINHVKFIDMCNCNNIISKVKQSVLSGKYMLNGVFNFVCCIKICCK